MYISTYINQKFIPQFAACVNKKLKKHYFLYLQDLSNCLESFF